jgi:hypothetical protein
VVSKWSFPSATHKAEKRLSRRGELIVNELLPLH